MAETMIDGRRIGETGDALEVELPCQLELAREVELGLRQLPEGLAGEACVRISANRRIGKVERFDSEL